MHGFLPRKTPLLKGEAPHRPVALTRFSSLGLLLLLLSTAALLQFHSQTWRFPFSPATRHQPSNADTYVDDVMTPPTHHQENTVHGIKYNTSGKWDPKAKINMHLVAHTHDDVGWLVTVDQYYVGRQMSTYAGGVQYIIDTVVQNLAENPNRKFMYVEVAFFKRWWREQNDKTRALVRKLVKNGQLVFINGGWCMNDEASVHYLSTIDQMTLGHHFLDKVFGVTPRIGWQIDPFGHSTTHAALLAMMGFDAFYFGRIDYADKAKRMADKTMEFVWDGSASLGKQAQIFAGMLYRLYMPPEGFSFDNDDPIVDDPRLTEYNVEATVEKFVQHAQRYSQSYATNNVLVTMGADFTYHNAQVWFKNMDKLIHYVNKDGRVNVFYSNPEIYTDAVLKSGHNWTHKADDFFPFADRPHSYWTGYFTSRPALKRYERVGMGTLQACRQLEHLSGGRNKTEGSMTLARAVSVAQHHDAVSGTSKQAVADDYAMRLARGISECQQVFTSALGHSISSKDHKFGTPQPTRKSNIKPPGPQLPNLAYCNLLNVSVCETSETATKSFSVVVYNSLGQERCDTIRVPVSFEAAKVSPAAHHSATKTPTIPLSEETLRVRGQRGTANRKLAFDVCLPALGFSVYTVESADPNEIEKDTLNQDTEDTYILDNNAVKVAVSKTSGSILSITVDDTEVNMTQDWLYYVGSEGTPDDSQASGAYIFRPRDQEPLSAVQPWAVKTERAGDEVRVQINDWMSQVIRLPRIGNHVEIEYTVGPVNVSDQLGKEVIVRYNSDVESEDIFFTDSSGREFLERKRDHRPTWELRRTEPVSQNYYPINTHIGVRGGKKQLTVLVDRAVGGTSLASGQVELMVHRRLLHDDARGVDEPLNEPGEDGAGLIIRTTHRLLVSTPESAASFYRPLAQSIAHPPIVAFSSEPLTVKSVTTLKEPLPPNVHLLSLLSIGKNLALLRLEHIFAKGEDETLSSPATIDLSSILDPTHYGHIESVTERSLTDNNNKTQPTKHPWDADDDTASTNQNPRSASATTVTLNPMEIRTFRITFKGT
eukprot:comp23400_c0_seq1/m.38816 comp23400_c0_seq1/g.38816  ORF comp23400_c0_seq1/g.38816 comp23400_c0_seq1/m.38816 type:complete len:1049 (-) comp23400_c0_seq1:168-3314(-)